VSRIGNRKINIPTGVEITIAPKVVEIKGKHGQLTVDYPKTITVTKEDNIIIVTRINDIKQTKMIHGTVNANVNNAIIGVSEMFSKHLVLNGVGYKGKIEGKNLILTLGFSHPVILEIPTDLKIVLPVQTEISVTGIDKQKVGQFCAEIRAYRKPEPYKGKGVLFKGEKIIRKVGKTADR